MRKVTFGCANSLDNYIAREDGSYDWLMHGEEANQIMKDFWPRIDTMIMGRKTFDSLPGILPGRRHIVMTRDSDWNVEGVEVVHDVDSAIAAAGDEPISVIGGAAIFELFEPIADKIELTEVIAEIDGDVSMPDLRSSERLVEVVRDADGDVAYGSRFGVHGQHHMPVRIACGQCVAQQIQRVRIVR